MKGSRVGLLLGAGTIVLLVCFGIVAQFSAPPNIGFKDSATILSVITATAIGIERVIEACWTGIGLALGSWRPHNVVGNQVNNLVMNLDAGTNK